MASLPIVKRAGFQQDATGQEKSSGTACEGWIKKLSHKGAWQSRYFGLTNGYLNYYNGADKKTILASISLATCSACEPVDLQSGEFNLIFGDGSTYSLRASDSKHTSIWCDALSERIDWAKTTKSRGNPAGGRKRGGDADDDEGLGSRRDRRKAGRRTSNDDDGGSEKPPARRAGVKRGDDSDDDRVTPSGRGDAGAAFRPDARKRVDSDDENENGRQKGPGRLSGRSNTDSAESASAGTGLTQGTRGGSLQRKRVDSDEADSDRDEYSRSGGAGLGRRDNRRDAEPVAPPAPTMEGWVKKKARTKFGQWQARYLRLADGVLYFADDDAVGEFSNSVDVATVTEVRPAAGRGATAAERKVFILSTSFEQEMQLRAADEKAVSDWVANISAARQHKKEYGGKAKRKRARTAGSDDNDRDHDAAVDSDADSDGDGGGASGLPPPPAWWREYERQDQARWMNATQHLLEKLFGGIYEVPRDGSKSASGEEEGVGADGDPAERRVVISKLAEAATRGCAELEDRAMEARMRGRAEIVKHLIQFFDLKFLNELTPLTTGTAPGKLSTKQLLQLIDCIEGFTGTRKRAIGSMTLSSQESRPGMMLRETARGLMSRYMVVMGPKLHTVAEKVLAKLRAEKGALVRRTLGTRVGTNSPTDLFNLMSEHIKIAKEGGSSALQRRLLSSVMAEVVFFAREVLMELMDWWARTPADVDMDYVTAVINDAGLMLDHIEQLEAYFADALHGDTEDLRAGVASSSGDQVEDDMDRQEVEQAREDLAAIEQDIPRAKTELVNAGCQLTGVLVDIVTEDFKDPLTQLFASAWEKGNHVTVVTVTATDYLSESRLLLDPFFFDRLASMALAHLVEQYMLRLLAPELVRKDRKDKKFDFKGGFSSKYKLTEERLKKLVADVVEIGNCFVQFMAREDLALIMQSLNSVREMLTIDVDNLLTVLEVAIRNHPVVATHVYLSFERCIASREDLNKAERKSLVDDALRILRDCGQPPDEDDELVALGGQLGAGVMHGASMSQGAAWQPAHVTNAIFRSVFPTAAERAKVLFKDWVPPARLSSPPMSPITAASGQGAFGSPSGPLMSMDAFMVPSGTGSAQSRGGLGASAGMADAVPRKRGADVAAPSTRVTEPRQAPDAESPMGPSFTGRPDREKDRGRRRRGRGDDDD